MPDETIVLKEFTCTIDIDFATSYMAKNEEEFVDMVIRDFYEDYGFKLSKSEITNIKEIK